MKRNPCLASLKDHYLFPLINKKKNEFIKLNPHAKLISLGIGDTTEPLSNPVVESLVKASSNLGTITGYSGYGPEQGRMELREKIASTLYSNMIHAEEVFVSDGAKCDIGRLQMLFGADITIALQDPVYPVYYDGSLIQGITKIVPMPCTPENHFFPDLNLLPKVDLLYFCSPNNPTGAVATREQLQSLVDYAISNHAIIIFDSAYSHYIQDPSLPKSIYEIKDAKKVAIEVGSFSKLAGFTGVRLGWTIVPEELKYEGGQSVRTDWNRITSTVFNGASNIAQQGGFAVLEKSGLQACSELASFYLENAQIIKKALENIECEVFGGTNAPYLWVRFKGQNSWDVFQHFLEKCHIVTTPGSGFGMEGEGYIRLSAFGHRENILEAAERLTSCKNPSTRA